MFKFFFPKKALFFDLFDQHAALTVQAAIKFQESLLQQIDTTTLRQIKPLEHEADMIARQISEILHKTFLTPFDRDLIYTLVSRMDDAIDAIDATADCSIIYKIYTPTDELIILSGILTHATAQLQKAVNGLRYIKQPEPIRNACAEINRFEHEADDGLRSALENLFQNEPDTRKIIIWKEIYESIESATDRCSDVADAIEGILLEND